MQAYFGRAKAACLCSYCCNRRLCYDGGRLGRVKIVTLRVGAGAKEGEGEGIFLPSFRVSTCAFASKTFARPKKTPALQATWFAIALAEIRTRRILRENADRKQSTCAIGHGELVYLLVIFSGELQTFWTSVTPPSTVHQYGVNYGKGHTIQKRYRGPAEISGTDSTQSTPRLKPRKNPPRNGTKSVDELSVSGVAVRPTKQAAGVRRS